MRGLMMDMPLMISSLLQHADRFHGDTEIVARLTEGGVHRYTYAAAHRRSRQLANALLALGVQPGERIGTLAWNNQRHFELYFGVSGIGAVCHTVNPRLFAEQIIYIINHAEDSIIFFDLSFVPLVQQLAPHCPKVKTWVLMTERSHLPQQTTLANLTCYEDLLNGHSDVLSWPEFDENAASSMCYTSGTTGNPKGVVYSHRSTMLHTLASALPDVTGISARDVILPVVPMFHANAWGLNYSAAMVGAKLVFPGPFLDGKSLFEMYEQENVTFTAGVPTIWLGLLTFMRENKLKFSTLKRATVGGAACPPAIIRAFQDEYGVQMLHGWGMTETSPIGTLSSFKAKHAGLSGEERLALQAKQGRALFGVQLKIVDGEGKQLPHDGSAFGDLLVRGPWVASGYFKQEGGDVLRRDEHGQEWFPTGDVANIDPDGYLQITDRSKDVIKSGGEWISSIELENIAVGHPAVAEAAVIGVAHPKWDERPLLIVALKPGATATREELLAFYEGKVARWSQPDDVVFVDSLPHTATGKLLKTKLRADFADHRLPAG